MIIADINAAIRQEVKTEYTCWAGITTMPCCGPGLNATCCCCCCCIYSQWYIETSRLWWKTHVHISDCVKLTFFLTITHSCAKFPKQYFWNNCSRSFKQRLHVTALSIDCTDNYNAHTQTNTRPFFWDYLGEMVPERQTQSGFYWSKRQWVAVASAGPYASLHLAPDR